jgi:hypothetical protein
MLGEKNVKRISGAALCSLVFVFVDYGSAFFAVGEVAVSVFFCD